MEVASFIIFMALFAAVYIILGYIGYRKTKTAEDYFVAGRKMGGLVIAFSYGATFISAVALIGFSGIASIYGYGILWLAFLNVFVGIFIAFVFYGFRTRKMGLSLNALTMPELIGKRFNSTKLQGVSASIISVFMIAYTAAVFLAIASLVHVSFGIPYETCVIIFTVIVGVYIIVGGLYAVMWTHTLQGVLMVVGMIILTVAVYGMLGGIAPAHEAAANLTQDDLAIDSLVSGPIPNNWTFETCEELAEIQVESTNMSLAEEEMARKERNLTIISITPGNATSNVSLNQPIIIIFSKKMNTNSVVYTCQSDPGGWQESWNAAHDTLTLTHNAFAPKTTYTVNITKANDAGIGSPAATQSPNGLTSLPPFLSKPFMMLLTLIFGVGIGVLAQPQLVVRYLTAKDERALRLAIPYGAIFILLMTFTAFCIGPLCNVFMVDNGLMYPGSPDKVLPMIVSELFPPWFIFLFLFAILAAAMSTASGLFHTAGACVGRDIYDKAIKKGVSGEKSVKVTRYATVGIVIATLILSLRPPDVVAFMCAFFFGLMGGTFLAVYTLTLYWKKMSRAGAWAGMLGGFLFTILWYIFVYFKTAPNIIGTTMVSSYKINMLDPLFIAIPLSFLLAYTVSKVFKQDSEEKRITEKAFENIE